MRLLRHDSINAFCTNVDVTAAQCGVQFTRIAAALPRNAVELYVQNAKHMQTLF